MTYGYKEEKSIEVMNDISRDIVSSKMINSFIAFIDVSPLTVKAYRAGISQLFEYLSNERIRQPKRENIIDFKNYLIHCGRKPSTVALYLSAVRRFFTWCESEGLYPDITRGVKSPRQERSHKRDAFSANELKAIISGLDRKTLEDKRNFAMFTLITACGLRTCEIVRANVGDIHRIAGVLVLDIQGKGHASKDSFVKITPMVEKAITEYLSARGNVQPSEPLFASCSRRNRGWRLTTRTVSGVCKSAMKAAGFDSHRLTAHSLRHSAVTLALMGGMTLQDTQAFARHANIATTLVYSHDVSRLKSLCEATISRAIFGNAY
ncbi:MAG: tyrosine-type recombinase/integrase [Synergistaceae bacterium]|nr:tyrosine-type recombinase/integrase [Synergistaceae bacterium]